MRRAACVCCAQGMCCARKWMNWIKQVVKGPLKPSIETLTLVIAHKKAVAIPSALLVHLSVVCVCWSLDAAAAWICCEWVLCILLLFVLHHGVKKNIIKLSTRPDKARCYSVFEFALAAASFCAQQLPCFSFHSRPYVFTLKIYSPCASKRNTKLFWNFFLSQILIIWAWILIIGNSSQ